MPNLFECLGYKISQKELNSLLETISINYFYIIAEWKKFFGVDEEKYYC